MNLEGLLRETVAKMLIFSNIRESLVLQIPLSLFSLDTLNLFHLYLFLLFEVCLIKLFKIGRKAFYTRESLEIISYIILNIAQRTLLYFFYIQTCHKISHKIVLIIKHTIMHFPFSFTITEALLCFVYETLYKQALYGNADYRDLDKFHD